MSTLTMEFLQKLLANYSKTLVDDKILLEADRKVKRSTKRRVLNFYHHR